MNFDTELVGKIGSMALIREAEHDMDYNVFSRIGSELRPGFVWVSSGAVEIGWLDYIKRTGCELSGPKDAVMTDYSSQGQAILMEEYRRYIPAKYSVRQLLVEHTHFNDREKREHIDQFLMRCVKQNAIPIVNYNDTVSFEENRRWELEQLRNSGKDRIVECIDNDETAAVIASLVHPRYLLIYTSVDGIYLDPKDPTTLVETVEGRNPDEVIAVIDELQTHCSGASRAGAAGAKTKLEFIKEPIRQGTTVFIANSKYRISDILSGNCKRTVFQIR
ncbi:MAG: uridylate kinase [Clostridiales bacterium 43-6]|nr:MAG: uridylate kinase [Clostridiales bacterium 43-6]